MHDQTPVSMSMKLRPRARILRTLGDELISSATVAVIELVKNAFDADATYVCIRFEGTVTGSGDSQHISSSDGQLLVVDNGLGMTPKTIANVWMEPATANRKRRTVSEVRKRRVLGEKGIGRFAVSHLADELLLTSRRAGSDSEVSVYFDWTWFDSEDAYLDEISTEIKVTEPKQIIATNQSFYRCSGIPWDATTAAPHGTILTMTRLRSDWSRTDLQKLRTALSRLVLPELSDADVRTNDFSICLDLPLEFHELGGLVTPPETLRNPHYFVDGEVKHDGTFQLELEMKGTKLLVSSEKTCLGHPPPSKCGPFRIRLLVWDRSREDLLDLATQYGSTLKSIREDLDKIAGVNVYRDGFRVLPYGERQNDWLRLDMRRVQNPTMRLSNNQVAGYVYISADGNPNLRDQTNREGLLEGPALDDLRNLVLCVFSELEAKRYDLRRRDIHSQPRPGGLFTGFSLSEVSELVRLRHHDDAQLISILRQKEQDLEIRVEEAQSIIARYRRLATLGQLTDTILHDGRQPLAKVQNEAILAIDLIERSNPQVTIFETLKRRLQLILGQATFIADVFRKIEPFSGRKRGRPKDLILEEIIERSFEVLSGELERLQIRYSIPQSKTQCRVEEVDMQQVFVNLIQNSLYWLALVPQHQRIIKVLVEDSSEAKLAIIFSDNGPGVDDTVKDYIFDPYFSTKPNGIGLGLTIAGEILNEYYDGGLELLGSGPLDGATFRIVMNKRV